MRELTPQNEFQNSHSLCQSKLIESDYKTNKFNEVRSTCEPQTNIQTDNSDLRCVENVTDTEIDVTIEGDIYDDVTDAKETIFTEAAIKTQVHIKSIGDIEKLVNTGPSDVNTEGDIEAKNKIEMLDNKKR